MTVPLVPPEKGRRTVAVKVRLTPEVAELLKQAAEDCCLNVSEYVTMMVKERSE